MRSLLCLLFVFGLTLQAFAAPGLEIEARLEQSANPLPFGKPATLVLDLSWDEKWRFEPPAADTLKLEGLTLLDSFSTSPAPRAGKKAISYHFVFTKFEPGPTQVPGVTFETPSGPIKSPVKKIVFKGAEAKPGDKPDQLRGPKDVVPLSTSDFWWWLAKAVGASLLGLALLALIVSKLGFLDRFLSPRNRALRRLKKLSKAIAVGGVEPPAALLEAVEILRAYLHAAHGFVTREATSREISEQLILSNRCPELKPTARKLLEYGDRAKFARREPNLEESRDLVEQLRQAISGDKRGAKK